MQGVNGQMPYRQIAPGQKDLKMILLGFNPEEKKFLTNAASNPGIQVSYLNDRFSGFSYELVISLEKLGLNFKNYTVDPEKFLSIIFETGYLQTEVQTGGQGDGGGGRSGGRPMGGRGGGMRTGGGRPSGGGGNPQDRMQMMQEMTHPTRLAFKQVHLAAGE